MKICDKCGRNENKVIFTDKLWVKNRGNQWCIDCFEKDRENRNIKRKKKRNTPEGRDKLLQERQWHKKYQKEYCAKYYQDNKEYLKNKSLEWAKNNPEQKKKQRKRQNQKRKLNHVLNFHDRIRKRLLRVFNEIGLKKESRTQDILGYSAQELFNHLSKYINKFCECCNLIVISKDNCHIDHIVPICSAITENDAIKLNQLNNLRLICKTCNTKKSTVDKRYKYMCCLMRSAIDERY